MTFLAGAIPDTAAWGLGIWPTLGLFVGIPLAAVLAVFGGVYGTSRFARSRDDDHDDE